MVIAISNGVYGNAAYIRDMPPLRHANIDGLQMQLMDRNGKCQLIYSVDDVSEDDQYALDIPGPCRFHVNKSGGIRTMYDSGYVYVLIESSRQMPRQPHDCETHLQSVRIKGKLVEVSQHTDRVASCPPFQWDAFMFKELFD